MGTIVSVERARVRIRWDDSGHTTAVRRSHLNGSGSRGYVLIGERKAAPSAAAKSATAKPTTVAHCRVGRTPEGRRQYRCFGCGRLGTLTSPWHVVMWTREDLSTVVCGPACEEIACKRARPTPRAR